MRLDRRTLVDSLERIGRSPVPPASPDFAVRTEGRLRSLPPVTLVNDDIAPAPARPRRPVPWVPALVAAAVIGLLALAPRAQRPDVAVITDRSSTTTTTSATTTTPPTTRPAPATTTTTVAPEPVTPPAKAPVVTTVPKLRPGPTTTLPARPAPTTTVPVEPTIPPVTTTAPPPMVKLELRCVAGTREGVPVVTCTWGGAGDAPVATWRVYRAVGADAKRTVWTASEPATTSYTDHDVVVGTMYRYAVEGVDTGGRTVAKTAIVEVACCPA